ncbi:MAG: S9 family peptidase [Candidatus Hydrogenedentes bacterium]|nr:S9 family peptidase [Candidatus Hydrogenedentota bacterium]
MSLALASITGAHAVSDPITKPHGEWTSPITSDLIVAESIRVGAPSFDGDDIYWLESRPQEKGRSVLVRRTPDGNTKDLTPPPFNVRTRVHEYGGGAYVVRDSIAYFTNFADQRVYRQPVGEKPAPVTPDNNMRYADFVAVPNTSNLVAVREDHSGTGEAVNTVILLDGQTEGSGKVLVEGNDFYSAPRVSPDGTKLAWLTWNHPNMPWDGTELWVGEIREDGSLGQTERVAGGIDECVFQPEWSPDGTLYFVSDRTGWWNLYRRRERRTERLCQMEAEFGLPQWVFGMSTYAIESADRIICTYTQQGTWHLASLDTATGELQVIETPYTSIGFLRAEHGRVLFLGASRTEPTSVVHLDLATHELEVLRRSSEVGIDPGYLSKPHAIRFPTEQGLTAHGFFYAPKNLDYVAPSEEQPPLIVISHGGPTAATSGTLNLMIQHWTSRGIAVLDVNYGGSTGYGRAYRERLNGQWGVVDVDDCVNGARYLVEQGKVDGGRLIIRGGSAGGYTTLCALTFRDVFKAGASYFGVSDLEALAKETHKFESRYLDQLIGPYPERRDLYRERSPLHFIEHLSCPVIFFQGLEDKVVLPNQAELMVEALRTKGLPVAYVPFEGEQHGFRRAENIKRALDGELYFYSRVFGFELADPVEPVVIENL